MNELDSLGHNLIIYVVINNYNYNNYTKLICCYYDMYVCDVDAAKFSRI